MCYESLKIWEKWWVFLVIIVGILDFVKIVKFLYDFKLFEEIIKDVMDLGIKKGSYVG